MPAQICQHSSQLLPIVRCIAEGNEFVVGECRIQGERARPAVERLAWAMDSMVNPIYSPLNSP